MRWAVAQLRAGVALSAAIVLVAAPLPFAHGSASHSGAVSAPDSTASSRPAPAPPGPSVPVSVAIDPRNPRPAVPAAFLGLSFEAATIPEFAHDATGGDLVSLLRSLGPGVLRFGGVSADTQTAWTDAQTPLPPWASVAITDGDLHALARLAARSGWHILLTLGLDHFEPEAAAREAAAAKAALGKWLLGIELGNEPDAYGLHEQRPQPWSFTQYLPEVLAYRQQIAQAAPHLALAGPDVSGSHAFAAWGQPEASQLEPALLTGHHYPLGCHKVPAPSIQGLLSPHTRLQEQRSLARYMRVAEAARIPFRMTEANTVSCGGTAGISNTFASALWATDYIARSMTSGLDGINLQGAPGNCRGYSPVCAATPQGIANGRLHAQPEWYALLLARALVGDRPAHTVIERTHGANVDVRSLVMPDGGLHVVVVDDDPPGSIDAGVRLRVGRSFAGASVLRLIAPAPQSTSSVSLGGSAVAADGTWQQPASLPTLPDRRGVVTVKLPASSAALVTIAPRPAARARH